jgi:hypothetical protein
VHAQAKVDDGLGPLSKIEVFAQHGDQGYMDYDDGLGKAAYVMTVYCSSPKLLKMSGRGDP